MQKPQENVSLQKKEKCSLAEMKEKATAMNPDTGFPFEQALKKPGMSFICEVKKASPSKGIIAEDFPYLEIAKEYETAGASAISCLTEPEYFKGDKRYLKKLQKPYPSRFYGKILPWIPI